LLLLLNARFSNGVPQALEPGLIEHGPMHVDKLYAAILTRTQPASSHPNIVKVGMTQSNFQQEITNLKGSKYYLSDLSVARKFGIGAPLEYSGVWSYSASNPYPPTVPVGLSSASYQSLFNNLTQTGYRLLKIRGAPCPSSWGPNEDNSDAVCYAAIFDKSPAPGPWVAYHGVSSAQHQANFNMYTKSGYRLVDVSGADGLSTFQDYYAALYIKAASPAWVAYHGLDSAGLSSQVTSWKGKGYRLVHLSGYLNYWKPLFTIIMDTSSLPGATTWELRYDRDETTIQADLTAWSSQGYQVAQISEY